MISKLLKKDKKGFTLMEMLIVVAIIAILVAIMIPTFNSQLEKAREAADAANIRAAYAEVMVQFLDADGNTTYPISETVDLQQAKADWQTAGLEDNLKQLVSDGTYTGTPASKGTCTVSVAEDGSVTISYT